MLRNEFIRHILYKRYVVKRIIIKYFQCNHWDIEPEILLWTAIMEHMVAWLYRRSTLASWCFSFPECWKVVLGRSIPYFWSFSISEVFWSTLFLSLFLTFMCNELVTFTKIYGSATTWYCSWIFDLFGKHIFRSC